MAPEDRNLAEREGLDLDRRPEHLTARSEHQNGTFSASYENVRAAAIMSGCIVKTGLFQDSLSQYRTFSGERINRVRSVENGVLRVLSSAPKDRFKDHITSQ
jgi:hypothetical protein